MSKISTTISHGINLSNAAYASPLTITATGAVIETTPSYSAVFGPNSGGPWTVVNQGLVSSTGSYGSGIVLADGGVVSNSGEVTGTGSGVVIKGATGSVGNLGTIVSEAQFYRSGVYLGSGGNVTNGSSSDRSALIEAQWIGAQFARAGTLTNFGTIESLGTQAGTAGHNGLAVFMPLGGEIVNHGLIEAAGGTGIYIGGSGGVANPGAVGTVSNFGTVISSGRTGIALAAGGTIANSGTVESNAQFDRSAVFIGGTLGRVVNGPNGATSALIEAQWVGVELAAGGTLTNYGTIESTGTALDGAGHRGLAVFLPEGGRITNGGLIEATYFTAIYGGGSGGVANPGATLTIGNFGTVESGSSDAIGLAEGGVIINGQKGDTGALIAGGTNSVAIYVGGSHGTLNSGATGMVTNFGTIESNTTVHSAIILAEGGFVDNSGKKALIAGGLNGVSSVATGGSGGPLTVVNSGTIEGKTGDGILLGDGGTVTDTGLIKGVIGIDVTGGTATVVDQGTIQSTGSIAVDFSSSSDVLVLYRSYTFIGAGAADVLGGGGTLELAGPKPGALGGLGTFFQSFGTIRVDPKAVWTLSGDASGSTLVNDGKILVTQTGSLVFGAVGEDAGKHGTIDIVNRGQAEFAGTVDKGQSLHFIGQRGFLQLDQAAAFGATISGFKKGDTIDLAGVTGASITSFSKGKLTIANSGSPITLTFKGQYTAKEFTLTAKGGDTWITIGKPTAAAAPGFVYAGHGATNLTNPGAHEGAIGGGGFVLFGGAAAPAAGTSDPGALLPWASDPFHFWTIQG